MTPSSQEEAEPSQEGAGEGLRPGKRGQGSGSVYPFFLARHKQDGAQGGAGTPGVPHNMREGVVMEDVTWGAGGAAGTLAPFLPGIPGIPRSPCRKERGKL